MSGGFPSDLGDPGGAHGHDDGATPVSELVATPGRRSRRNRSESLRMAAVARRVHSLRVVMYAVVPSTLLLAGCPPTPLSLDEPDAQPNAPPAIVSVRDQTGTEFISGVGPNLTSVDSMSTMTLTLFDTNADDTLYVRAFNNIDLAAPNPARTVCNVGPSDPPSTTRTVTCDTRGFCMATGQAQMNILACDRLPLDSGPNYFSCEGDAPYDDRAYQVQCMVEGL